MKDNSNPDINFNDDRSTRASNLYIYMYIYIYIRSLNVIIFHKEWYKISLELAKKFQPIREHSQKTFVTLSQFWLLTGLWFWGIRDENHFFNYFKSSSEKLSIMVSADVKTDLKLKRTDGYTL